MKWLIVITSSATPLSYIAQTVGNIDTVKKKLLDFILKDADKDKNNFRFGHKSIEHLIVENDCEILGRNYFKDYEISYSAIKLNNIEKV